MFHRLFLVALVGVLLLLAMLLRSLGDANPLTATSFLGCELWTLKAAVPVGVAGAGLAVLLWGVTAAVLRHGRMAKGCWMVALPIILTACWVAPDACLPFAQPHASLAPLAAGWVGLLAFALLNLAGGWAIISLRRSWQARCFHPSLTGLAVFLLATAVLQSTSLLSEGLADYYPAWELGFACWLSYLITLTLLIFLLALRALKEKQS